jgi:hypothetical protein
MNVKYQCLDRAHKKIFQDRVLQPLLHHTDAALYTVKAAGYNGYCFYTDALEAEIALQTVNQRDAEDGVKTDHSAG